MDIFSFLNAQDIESIENLYNQYKKDPDSVDSSWKNFFMGFEFSKKSFKQDEYKGEIFDKEFKVINLIEAYRKRGHLFTKTNPVRTRRQYFPTLELENYGLSPSDLDTPFHAGKEIGIGTTPLKDIIQHLQQTYCQSIGAEFIFIRQPDKTKWLQEKMEKSKNTPVFSKEEKKLIFFYLKIAVGFEQFIHKKFIGQKRFSLEGTETLIPALHYILDHGAELGIREFIIGMSHRGRLNVLGNVLNKPYENIFKEFEAEAYEERISLGDVKYHLGYGNNITTAHGKKIRLNLAPNPSHLEAVSPVIQGIARAKINHKYQKDFSQLCPILIHGDAAIAGQGVVYEVIQMSGLEGYKTGGTVHLVINNQVGFTTNYLEGRTSTYCTDIGKVTKAPIFHVNGDDVEALVFTIKMAMEYRQIFQSDVFIDILSYRKYGHNEGDDPRFTQPVLYDAIAKHPNPRDLYAKELIDQQIYSVEEIKQIEKDFDDILEEKFKLSKNIKRISIKQFLIEDWENFRFSRDEDFLQSPETGIPIDQVLHLSDKINNLPGNKKFFSKIVKLMNERKKMVKENRVDWAMAELLAYGSLVSEGYPVRVSGQDSVRGTFSHRHASLVIQDTDKKHTPLEHVNENQAPFFIYNSPLNEYGVLGFEYGYSLATPRGLTIWEAQFGDFSNVAQVVIDQYISSAEEKWGIMNGLVLYLPHGYEGQGPEHSSARIERWLNISSRNNMQIVNITSPANLFHVLRRQLYREFRVPLIIFTPKSLLRHPKCISTLNELSGKESFQEVYDDNDVDINEVRRLVFCSGKIYYDLLEQKEQYDARDIAVVRIEQLHPFPMEIVKNILSKYKNVLLHLWVQEEPENMGPWFYIKNLLEEFVHIVPVTRLPSGSPAVGLHKLHMVQQEEIISKVFRKCDCELQLKYCGLQCVMGKTRKEIMKQHEYFDKSI